MEKSVCQFTDCGGLRPGALFSAVAGGIRKTLWILLPVLAAATVALAVFRMAETVESAVAPEEFPLLRETAGAPPAPAALPGVRDFQPLRCAMRVSAPSRFQLLRTGLTIAAALLPTASAIPVSADAVDRRIDKAVPEFLLKTLRHALAVRAGPRP